VTARRAWILVIVAALFAIVPIVGAPGETPGDRRDERAIPSHIASYTAREIPLSPRTLALLGTDRVVNREYRDPEGASVHLCVVRARDRRTSFHPPEVCYRGWGYEIQDRDSVEIDGPRGPFTANRMVIEKPGRRLLCLFWYTSGGRPHASFVAQQLRVLFSPFFGGSGEGALVRLSTGIDGDLPAADARLRAFARALVRDVEKTRHAAGR